MRFPPNFADDCWSPLRPSSFFSGGFLRRLRARAANEAFLRALIERDIAGHGTAAEDAICSFFFSRAYRLGWRLATQAVVEAQAGALADVPRTRSKQELPTINWVIGDLD